MCADTQPRAQLKVMALVDPVVERHGFRADSSYIEFCWLPVLGPTATWLYRRLAIPLLVVDELEVELVDLAVSLGLGEGLGRHAPLTRALGRLVKFAAARPSGRALHVRRALAPLTVKQAARLSLSARQHHDRLTQR